MKSKFNKNLFLEDILNIFKHYHQDFVLETSDVHSYYNGFLIPLVYMGMAFSLISVFSNILLNFSSALVVLPIIAFFVYLGFYFFVKKSKNYNLIVWGFIIVTFIFINATWYYDFGSRGPWSYLLVLLFSYMMFMMKGRQLRMLILLLFFDLLALFLIEYNFTNIIPNYPNHISRIVDNYLAIFLYSVMAYIFMNIIKQNYQSAYEHAMEADRLKTSFLANMSHEIRTPLNAIVGFSNLIAESDLSEEDLNYYSNIINSNNDVLLRLIDDVLDVSLFETGQIKMVKENCDLTQMLSEIAGYYNKILEEGANESVVFVLSRPKSRVTAVTDCSRIRQALTNLINNSIKFTEKGEIELAMFVEEGTLRFVVKDNGIGIHPKHIKHLFDRFYKVEDYKEKLYSGTGIGLYLVKMIVEMMGGEIQVQSEYKKGSVFEMKIPVENIRLQEGKNEKKTGKVEDITSNHVILIVEDEKMSSLYLEKILASDKIKILIAGNGESGIEIFEKHPEIDLVLLDIKLPGITGFEVIKQIKKLRPEVPVIAQTAFAMLGDEKKFLNAGFDDYISKPIDKDLFMAKVASFLT